MTSDSSDTETLENEPVEAPVLETFLFAVEGDNPGEHARKIEQLLSGFEGLTKAEAHATDQRVVITYDSRYTDPAAIHQRLEDLGYKASPWAG